MKPLNSMILTILITGVFCKSISLESDLESQNHFRFAGGGLGVKIISQDISPTINNLMGNQNVENLGTLFENHNSREWITNPSATIFFHLKNDFFLEFGYCGRLFNEGYELKETRNDTTYFVKSRWRNYSLSLEKWIKLASKHRISVGSAIGFGTEQLSVSYEYYSSGSYFWGSSGRVKSQFLGFDAKQMTGSFNVGWIYSFTNLLHLDIGFEGLITHSFSNYIETLGYYENEGRNVVPISSEYLPRTTFHPVISFSLLIGKF